MREHTDTEVGGESTRLGCDAFGVWHVCRRVQSFFGPYVREVARMCDAHLHVLLLSHKTILELAILRCHVQIVGAHIIVTVLL